MFQNGDSPVQETLTILQNRLAQAETVTERLSQHLNVYGYKRLPAEKPDIETQSRQYSEKSLWRQTQTKEIHNKVIGKNLEISSELVHLQKRLIEQDEEILLYKDGKMLLEKQLHKLKNEVYKQMKKNELLDNDKKRLASQLEESAESIIQLEKDVATLLDKNSSFAGKREVLLHNYAEMETLLATEQSHVISLQKKCDSLSTNLIQASDNLCRQSEKRLYSESLVESLKSDLCKLNKKHDELSTLATLQKEDMNKGVEFKRMMMKKYDELAGLLNGFSIENEKLKRYSKRLIVEKEALLTQNKTLRNNECHLTGVEEKYETIIGEVERLRLRNERVNADLKEAKAQHQAECETHESDINRLTLFNRDVYVTLEEFQELKQQSELKLISVQNHHEIEKEHLRSKLNDMQASNELLTSEVNSWRKQANEREKDLQSEKAKNREAKNILRSQLDASNKRGPEFVEVLTDQFKSLEIICGEKSQKQSDLLNVFLHQYDDLQKELLIMTKSYKENKRMLKILNEKLKNDKKQQKKS